MRTSKTISIVSCNTLEFLDKTLKSLLRDRIISYYEYIYHLKDEDDKKNHFHVYMRPNSIIDTSSICDYFIEEDPKHIKPIKPQWCEITHKYGDWYWYNLHDKDYLKAKGLKRNVYYKDEQIVTSDTDTHYRLVAQHPLQHYAKFSDDALRNLICDAVYNNISLASLLSSDYFPLGKVQACVSFYKALEQCIEPSRQSKSINNYCKDIDPLPTPEELKQQILKEKYQEIINNPIIIDDLPFKNENIQLNMQDLSKDDLY